MGHAAHDLPLSDWGPYSKHWHGVSHIAEVGQGIRFDLGVAPGRYRRGMRPPAVMWESGVQPLRAASDLSYHQWHYDLGGSLSMELAVAAPSAGDEVQRLISCTFRNSGAVAENAVLHLLPSLHFPPLTTYSREVVEVAQVTLPPGACWVQADAYQRLSWAKPDHRDGLPYDGHRRGQCRRHGLVGGTGIGHRQGHGSRPFGSDAGDELVYELELKQPLPAARLRLRAALEQPGTSPVIIEVLGHGSLQLQDSTLAWYELPLGDLPAGPLRLCLRSGGGAPLLLDGFALVDAAQAGAVQVSSRPWQHAPQESLGPLAASRLLDWADVPGIYGLAWRATAPHQWRRFHGADGDNLLLRTLHDHVAEDLRGPGAGWYGDAFLRPLVVPAGGELRVQALVAVAPTAAQLSRFISDWDGAGADAHDRAVTAAASRAWRSPRPGIERLAATTCTNVVFPVETRGRWIRHFTPGRNWDSLYTWDSGFISLGLGVIDPDLAQAHIAAYLCRAEEDPDCAFIHHGTPLPVQAWAVKLLCDQGISDEQLRPLYAGLVRMHEFLIGRAAYSTTASLNSGLLRSWEYFYNSGGWDDYPPQWHLYTHPELASGITPVVISAQVCRLARLLDGMAQRLGIANTPFAADAEALSLALARHAWNPAAGHYSYVCHDEAGEPAGFFADPVSGADFNAGLDGLSPLVALCPAATAQSLIARLMDPARHRSPIGLSTVDMNAPYFRPDGYWNGAVWMPHQYFFWRACLDWGAAEAAWWIARTGLELWEREVAASGLCFEHFLIDSGRGAGWHHFSGLSTPPLIWDQAYHGRDVLSVGNEVWIEARAGGDQGGWAELQLRFTESDSGETTVILAGGGRVLRQVSWQGRALQPLAQGGAWALQLPRRAGCGQLCWQWA
ncbi:MAG: hypothetical protein EA402_08720 [Planctomycetota bacterium]|nr:MAG: hypothetical protein EA402_08720 [Planctomycetota bacterium]